MPKPTPRGPRVVFALEGRVTRATVARAARDAALRTLRDNGWDAQWLARVGLGSSPQAVSKTLVRLAAEDAEIAAGSHPYVDLAGLGKDEE